MTYTFKLSRRLAVGRALPVCALALLAACDVGDPLGSGSDVPGDLVLSPIRTTAEPYQNIRMAFRDPIGGAMEPSYDVEWTVIGGSGQISPDGSFTATAPGVYQVVGKKGKENASENGKSNGNGHKVDTSTVVVVPPPPSLAAVEVTPATASLTAGQHLQLEATGRNDDGSAVAIGVEWTATGGTIDAGGYYIAGTEGGEFRAIARHPGTGLADTARLTIASGSQPAPPPEDDETPGAGNGEDADFETLFDRAFDVASVSGWGPSSLSSNFSIVSSGFSGATPTGDGSAGRIRFPKGFEDGSSPAYVYTSSFPSKKTLYVRMWVQISPNWYGHSVNSKIGYVWTGDRPKVYFNLIGSGDDPQRFRIKLQNMNVTPSSSATANNLANPELERGKWHLIEMRLKVNTFDQADGTLEAWVNGEKVLEAGGLSFNGTKDWATTDSRNTWHQVEWRPIWGGSSDVTPVVPEDQYMYMDQLYVSGK